MTKLDCVFTLLKDGKVTGFFYFLGIKIFSFKKIGRSILVLFIFTFQTEAAVKLISGNSRI